MLILGLGSNLGNRQQNLDNAVAALSARLLDDVKLSSVIETAPLLPPQPDANWETKNFLNMAIGGTLKTKLSPQELLDYIKKLEGELGRMPSKRWSPRIIDIDILAWEDLIYETPTLTIPHIGLMERDFALKPLLEIYPNWQHPKCK